MAENDRWGSWPRADACIRVPVTTVWSAPDAPRLCDAAITQQVPRPERWMSELGNPERLDLLGRASTQALLGEPVSIITERNGWSEIRLPWQPTGQDRLGYPGWVPSAHVTAAAQPTNKEPLGCVTQRLTLVDDGGAPIPLSIGTVLPMPTRTTMRHPDGHELTVPQMAVIPAFDVFHTATQFLGIGYLWSGISGWGVDCSGFVMVSARANGILIPRDSADQFTAAQHGKLNLAPNSLKWFTHPALHSKAGTIRHVAFAAKGNQMLHAPRTGFAVEVIDTDEEPYATDALNPIG